MDDDLVNCYAGCVKACDLWIEYWIDDIVDGDEHVRDGGAEELKRIEVARRRVQSELSFCIVAPICLATTIHVFIILFFSVAITDFFILSDIRIHTNRFTELGPLSA